ncbi:MAG: peptidoglycan/LPS O-acetylase OafA/YrhL [Paracoccaceae bacterium]|jgi:peptidoglycan/LPS O-acetylase OafA/YrhL
MSFALSAVVVAQSVTPLPRGQVLLDRAGRNRPPWAMVLIMAAAFSRRFINEPLVRLRKRFPIVVRARGARHACARRPPGDRGAGSVSR